LETVLGETSQKEIGDKKKKKVTRQGNRRNRNKIKQK
jgi:hypothetical protein